MKNAENLVRVHTHTHTSSLINKIKFNIKRKDRDIVLVSEFDTS